MIAINAPPGIMTVIPEAGRVINKGQAVTIPSETEEAVRAYNPEYVWSIAQLRIPIEKKRSQGVDSTNYSNSDASPTVHSSQTYATDTAPQAYLRAEVQISTGRWPKYKASIVKQEEEDKAQKEREKAKQREDLAKRKGRSPKLRKLENKPRRR
ncbi:hypothetical protein DL770_008560 [Monosporascus sp. CRB-9-2]|nr:hypothetical protein DL770_008560 [Monosporascus sp. CRB-9-2]